MENLENIQDQAMKKVNIVQKKKLLILKTTSTIYYLKNNTERVEIDR